MLQNGRRKHANNYQLFFDRSIKYLKIYYDPNYVKNGTGAFILSNIWWQYFPD